MPEQENRVAISGDLLGLPTGAKRASLSAGSQSRPKSRRLHYDSITRRVERSTKWPVATIGHYKVPGQSRDVARGGVSRPCGECPGGWGQDGAGRACAGERCLPLDVQRLPHLETIRLR